RARTEGGGEALVLEIDDHEVADGALGGRRALHVVIVRRHRGSCPEHAHRDSSGERATTTNRREESPAFHRLRSWPARAGPPPEETLDARAAGRVNSSRGSCAR